MLKRIRLSFVGILLAGAVVMSACGTESTPTGAPAGPTNTTTTQGAAAASPTAAAGVTPTQAAMGTTPGTGSASGGGSVLQNGAIPIGIGVAQTSNTAL